MVRTLVVLGLVGLLAACGKSQQAPAVRLQVFGDPLEIRAYQELINAYRAKNPAAKIELIPVGRQNDHMAKLATSFAAGDAPELFVLNFRRFGQFATKDVLEPLGPAMKARGLWNEHEFYPQPVEAFQYEGVQQCLPQNASSLVVYWNRRLFAQAKLEAPKPDWTMRDLLTAAFKLQAFSRTPEGKGVYGLGFDPTLIRLAPFIWSFRGELVNDLHRPTQITLDGSAPLGLSFVKSLIQRYRVVPPLAAYKAEHHESRFVRGGLGMLLDSRRLTPTLRAHPELDWDVAPFPRLGAPVSVLHADAYCMAKSTRNKTAATDFVAFALGDEGQAILARSGRIVPSRISVAQSPVFLDPTQPPASAQVFLDALPHLKRTPNIAEWHEIETKADVLLEEWFYESRPQAGEQEGAFAEIAFIVLLRDALQPVLDRSQKK
ncbi:MAG: sugar ABC transporter substrate-binding protein [Pseudomonadota bacterium]